jgi:hypothetical protein
MDKQRLWTSVLSTCVTLCLKIRMTGISCYFAEFAYNNSIHESTGSTFRLNSGFDPNLPSSFSLWGAPYERRNLVAPVEVVNVQGSSISREFSHCRGTINLRGCTTEAKAYADTKGVRLNSRLRCCACIHSKFEFEKGSTKLLVCRLSQSCHYEIDLQTQDA